MASFDPEESRPQSNTSDTGIVKYPMKRLELSIRNFIKVLDIDLDRLHRHTENIKKLSTAEDWPGLHKEQVNASRTVQQINANIREIERARTQVLEKDLGVFDSKIEDVKMKALSAMDKFMMLIGQIAQNNLESKKKPAVEIGHGCEDNKASRPELQKTASMPGEEDQGKKSTGHLKKFSSFQHEEDFTDSRLEDNLSSPFGSTSASLAAFAPAPVTTALHVAPQHTDASNSWEQLQENIVELNELVHHFADQVEQQGEVINSIDENIETAHANVKEGTTTLVQASKYKSAMLPVVGAVVGGLVGGPIGFVAGMKLGGLAGVVGGAAGFAGGRMLKKHQQKISETEMQNLSDKNSISISEAEDSDSNKETARAEPNQNTNTNCLTGKCLPSTKGEVTEDAKSEQGLTGMYNEVASSFKSLFSQSSV